MVGIGQSLPNRDGYDGGWRTVAIETVAIETVAIETVAIGCLLTAGESSMEAVAGPGRRGAQNQTTGRRSNNLIG
jgi:hypothetical protein